jgi:MraZ protein
MLIGEYTHTLDTKKRISLPIRFRKEIGKSVVITRGFDNCLSVYSMGEWKKLSEKLKALSMGRADDRKFSRFILGGAVEVGVDSMGRILVPDFLKDFANLKNKVVWVGGNSHAEIWDEKIWKAYKKVTENQADVVAEHLGEIGII